MTKKTKSKKIALITAEAVATGGTTTTTTATIASTTKITTVPVPVPTVAATTTVINNYEESSTNTITSILNTKSKSKSKPSSKIEEQVPPEIPAISLPPISGGRGGKGDGGIQLVGETSLDQIQNQKRPSNNNNHNNNNNNNSSDSNFNSVTNTNKEQLKNKLFKSKPNQIQKQNQPHQVSLHSQDNNHLLRDQEREHQQFPLDSLTKSDSETVSKPEPEPEPDPETTNLLAAASNQNIRNYQSFETPAALITTPINGTTTYYIDSTSSTKSKSKTQSVVQNSNWKASSRMNASTNTSASTGSCSSTNGSTKIISAAAAVPSINSHLQKQNGHSNSNSSSSSGINFDLFERTLEEEIQKRENPTEFQNSKEKDAMTHGPAVQAPRPSSTKGSKDVCIDIDLWNDDDPGDPGDGTTPQPGIVVVKNGEHETGAKVKSKQTTVDHRASNSNSGSSKNKSQNQNLNQSVKCYQVPHQSPDSFADLKKLLAASKLGSKNSVAAQNLASASSSSYSSSSSSVDTQSKSKLSYANRLNLEDIKRTACAIAIANNPNSKIRVPSTTKTAQAESSLLKIEEKSEKDSEVEEILGLDLGHENNHQATSFPSGVGSQIYQLYSVPEDYQLMPSAGSSSSSQVNLGQSSQPAGAPSSSALLGLGNSSIGSISSPLHHQLGPIGIGIGKSTVSNNIINITATTSSSNSLTLTSTAPFSVSAGGSSVGLSSLTSTSGPGGLAACCSILDGINNLCEVQTCSKPASKKCASCKSAYYCSEDHQKCDWRKHKNQCIPYKMEVKSSDDVSSVSVMVAVRNIPAGKLIFAEKPFLLFPVASFDTDFVHVMDLNCVMSPDLIHTCGAKSPACLGCMKCVELGSQGIRHECSKCGLPLCSKQCEYEMSHQIGECQLISRCSDLRNEKKSPSCFHSVYLDVEILRALQLETLYPTEWEKFLELRNHMRVELYKKSERYGKFMANLERLVPYSAKVSGYNFDLIRDVHAIITALSFKPSLKSPYKMLIGTQLYFDHSCVPNTIHYVEHQVTGHVSKMRCVVKAAMPIMKGDVISLDFVPTPYLAYLLRRRVLENLCLNCSCRRCVQPSEIGDHSGDITCPNCRRGLVTPERPLEWKESIWSCRACQEEVPYSQVTQIYQDWRNQLYSIPKTRGSIDKLYNFIQKAQRHLNPTHELVVMAWCFIETIIRPNLENFRSPDAFKVLPHVAIQDYQLLSQYCDVSEKHFQALRPGLWLDRGVVLFQKFYATFALASKDYQEKRLQRKPFVSQILRSMKSLQDSLAILQTYEGYNATDSVNRLTQDAIWTLATVKTFIAKFMQDNAASLASSRSRSVDI